MRVIVAAVAGLAAGVLGAAAADSGFYRAVQCHPSFGVGQGAAKFQRTSQDFRPASTCGRSGEGLAIKHRRGRTPSGASGRWRIEAPPGTVLRRVRARVASRGGGGYVPRLMVARPGGGDAEISGIGGDFSAVSWSGTGTALIAQLTCARSSGSCGRTDRPNIRVKRVVLTLGDRVDPRVTGLGGSLLAGGTQRGDRVLAVRATDVGSGVRRMTVQVNGNPVAWADLAVRGECDLSRGMGMRLIPCPRSAGADFPLDTGARTYRQGPNAVRVCALDQGLDGTANSSCRSRRVALDNACPVVGAEGVARLSARFQRGGPQSPRTMVVRQGRGATIIGRASDSGGRPVAGARLCVGARLTKSLAAERVLARTLPTNASGRFRIRVGNGASRHLRVAHWSSGTDVDEQRLLLKVRARPSLRLRPRGILRTGRTLRFKVGLRGSNAGRKRVKIKVRPPGGGWQLINDACIGRTKPSGDFHCRYRFEATTGRRTYAFRAIVPKQRGYPYLPGKSAIRKQTVIGP